MSPASDRHGQQQSASGSEPLEAQVAQRTAELRGALTELGRIKHRLAAENDYLQREIGMPYAEIVGSSPPMRALLEQIELAAASNSCVLLTGEHGSGKELAARALHAASPRGARPLIKLDCAAIAPERIEAELFGQALGARRNGLDRNAGCFELAAGNTLFLDEVGALPLAAQAAVLNALQAQTRATVGSSAARLVDVRIVAASTRRLEWWVATGRFRADLYARLSACRIEVPPLRARRDDVPALARHFAARLERRLGGEALELAPDVLESLGAYDWPGNVRELEHVIGQAMFESGGTRLDIGRWLRAAPTGQPSAEPHAADSLAIVERDHIVAILRRTSGVIDGQSGAARLLDMKPSTVRYRIKKLGIRKTDYLR